MSGNAPTQDEFQSLYMQVQALTDDVEDLEKENRDLRNDLEDVKDARAKLDDALRTLSDVEDDLESLTRSVSSLERRVNALDEDTNDFEADIGDIEQELHDGRLAVEKKISKANKRLTGIESHLDIDEVDIGRAIREDASELEHLAALPERVRKNEINKKPVERAVEVYENFDRWSDHTKRGYIIKSGDLQKYMNEDLEWSQLYRVMEEFGKKTDEDYAYIDHPRHGKILIRFHPSNR